MCLRSWDQMLEFRGIVAWLVAGGCPPPAPCSLCLRLLLCPLLEFPKDRLGRTGGV